MPVEQESKEGQHVILREALERAHAEHFILLDIAGTYFYPLDVLDVYEVEAPELLDQKVYLGYDGVWRLDANNNLKDTDPMYFTTSNDMESE
jgi:hypothetical protein